MSFFFDTSWNILYPGKGKMVDTDGAMLWTVGYTSPLNKTFVEIIITSPTIYPNYVYLNFGDFGFSAT